MSSPRHELLILSWMHCTRLEGLERQSYNWEYLEGIVRGPVRPSHHLIIPYAQNSLLFFLSQLLIENIPLSFLPPAAPDSDNMFSLFMAMPPYFLKRRMLFLKTEFYKYHVSMIFTIKYKDTCITGSSTPEDPTVSPETNTIAISYSPSASPLDIWAAWLDYFCPHLLRYASHKWPASYRSSNSTLE